MWFFYTTNLQIAKDRTTNPKWPNQNNTNTNNNTNNNTNKSSPYNLTVRNAFASGSTGFL